MPMRIDGRFRKANEEYELAIRRMTVYLPDQPWLPAHRAARESVLSGYRQSREQNQLRVERPEPWMKSVRVLVAPMVALALVQPINFNR